MSHTIDSAEPRFPLRARVLLAAGYWDKDLAGRAGLISSPPPAVTARDASWGGRHWRMERRQKGSSRVYWIIFEPTPTQPGCAAEVGEGYLMQATG
jgi:hypothetical protein